MSLTSFIVDNNNKLKRCHKTEYSSCRPREHIEWINKLRGGCEGGRLTCQTSHLIFLTWVDAAMTREARGLFITTLVTSELIKHNLNIL